MWLDNVSDMDNILISYIRDNKNQKIGMLISGINKYKNNNVCIGWSLCNKQDQFDKYIGFDIAQGRTYLNDRIYENHVDENFNIFEFIPKTVIKNLPKFLIKIYKYYKKEELSNLTSFLLNSFFTFED